MGDVISEVLVGFDGSADAQRALEFGIAEAADRRADLRVLIAQGDRLSSYSRPREWVASVTAEWAEKAQDTLREAGLPADLVEIADESPAALLVQRSGPSTLVVLGSQGYGRISGSFIGSVSQHVTRYAEGPVVVMRPSANPRSTRIVVGVDGSGASEDALEFGFDRAGRTGAPLYVIYGWRSYAALSMSLGGTFPFGATLTMSKHGDEEAASAELLLAEAVAGLSEKYPDVEVHREAIPVPAPRLLADASQNAAMVVVGSRGRGAFAGLLLGSVSQAVLHHADCPVAVVR